MKHKNLVILSLLVAVALTGCSLLNPPVSKKAQVIGAVVDYSGQPIAAAKVTLAGKTASLDAEGNFSFTDVPYGTHRMRVILDGAAVYFEDITVNREQIILDDIVMDEDGFVRVTEWETDAGDDTVGQWEVENGGLKIRLIQHKAGSTTASLAAPVEQKGSKVTYEWTVTFGDQFDGQMHAGFHVMANRKRPYLSNGGWSYLVIQRAGNVALQKWNNNTQSEHITNGGYKAGPGDSYTYRVVLDTVTGQIEVYRDGERLGGWTDPDVLQTATYITTRVRDAVDVVFTNVRVKIEE